MGPTGGRQPAPLALLPHPRLVALSPGAPVAAGTPRRVHDSRLVPGGYRIVVESEGGHSGEGRVGTVTLAARDAAGLFYAEATLEQMVRASRDGLLPVGTVEDWPDLAVRGVMLDVSRTKVPTLETLRALVDVLASWKLNHLELYMEHTFAYSDHAEVWRDADPYTVEDLTSLRRYCEERHVDLVANQNTLGHMERWLVHERYAPLGVARGVVPSPFGMPFPASTLDPANPGSLALVRGLVAELGEALPGSLFHVGLDEPWQLPEDRRGEWGTWARSLRELPELDGRQMLVWGDFVAAHPELLAELERMESRAGTGRVTVCEWGYEANHPFGMRSEVLSAHRLEHWLCPGTSSWMSIGGRVSNAVENCRSAATAARDGDASGMLVTDWGDWGHLQYLPVSLPGLAAAAAFSWCVDSNAHLDASELGTLLDLHLYARRARRAAPPEPPRGAPGTVPGGLGGIGAALGILGDLHTLLPPQVPNMSSLVVHVYLPQLPVGSLLTPGIELSHLDQVDAEIERALQALSNAGSGEPEVDLAVSELRNTALLLQLASRDARARLGARRFGAEEDLGSLSSVAAPERARLERQLDEVLEAHRRLWTLRNRAGGLDESCAWLEHLRSCYESGSADPGWAGPLVQRIRERTGEPGGTR